MAKRDSNFNPIGNRRAIRRNGGGVADWASANADIIRRAIAAAAAVGGAIRFGYSRDGGAYAVGIYGNGEPYTDFVKPSESIDDFMEDVEQFFIDANEVHPQPEKGGKHGHQ